MALDVNCNIAFKAVSTQCQPPSCFRTKNYFLDNDLNLYDEHKNYISEAHTCEFDSEDDTYKIKYYKDKPKLREVFLFIHKSNLKTLE